MTRRDLKFLVKLDEMVVKSRRRHGKGLTTANKVVEWNQNVSDLSRPVQTLKNSRRFAHGTPRGPTPRVSAAAALMEVEVLKDRRPDKGCNQTVGQVALLRQGSGASR